MRRAHPASSCFRNRSCCWIDQSVVSARDLVDPGRVPSAPILRFRAQSYHLKKILQVLSIFDFALDGTISRSLPSRSQIYRSEEHTSELQSLMRISYAVFCLKKKNKLNKNNTV